MDSLTADWAWAIEQSGLRFWFDKQWRQPGRVGSGTVANSVAPIQITRSSDPNAEDDLGLVADADEVIGGLPYTIRFEAHADGDEKPSPIERGLWSLQSDPSRRLEFEICWAIIYGAHRDPDLLRAILGNPNGFDAAARWGLAFVRARSDEYLRHELTLIAERRQTAGAAELAREEDTKLIPKGARRKVKTGAK